MAVRGQSQVRGSPSTGVVKVCSDQLVTCRGPQNRKQLASFLQCREFRGIAGRFFCNGTRNGTRRCAPKRKPQRHRFPHDSLIRIADHRDVGCVRQMIAHTQEVLVGADAWNGAGGDHVVDEQLIAYPIASVSGDNSTSTSWELTSIPSGMPLKMS